MERALAVCVMLKGTKGHCLCGFKGNEKALFVCFSRERKGIFCVILKGTGTSCLYDFKGNDGALFM